MKSKKILSVSRGQSLLSGLFWCIYLQLLLLEHVWSGSIEDVVSQLSLTVYVDWRGGFTGEETVVDFPGTLRELEKRWGCLLKLFKKTQVKTVNINVTRGLQTDNRALQGSIKQVVLVQTCSKTVYSRSVTCFLSFSGTWLKNSQACQNRMFSSLNSFFKNSCCEENQNDVK